MKTIIKDFTYRDEHYSIVWNGRFYVTINHRFINDNGTLTQELRYEDGLHPGKTIAECVERTKEDLDVKYYISCGISKAEAMSKVLDIPMEIVELITNSK